MTFRKTLVAATSAAALALAAAPAVMPGAGSAAAQSEGAYSASDLDAFVVAFLEVSELRTVYTEQLQQTDDETQQAAIVEEGNSAIVSAIESVDGMDVELYSAILEQAGQDTDLNARITRRLQEAGEG